MSSATPAPGEPHATDHRVGLLVPRYTVSYPITGRAGAIRVIRPYAFHLNSAAISVTVARTEAGIRTKKSQRSKRPSVRLKQPNLNRSLTGVKRHVVVTRP